MDEYGFVSHEFTLESEGRKTDARRPSALVANIALRLPGPFDVRQAEPRCGSNPVAEFVAGQKMKKMQKRNALRKNQKKMRSMCLLT
ncbi:hypothetical protein [Herbaspirillum sp. NPDC101396]|uniref:hypothetical protein n=1 Tax=Herbaspirillum sp. NPDC101396 TaxID=3364005 RepID=UPI00383A57D9